jgi:hypothetical protein
MASHVKLRFDLFAIAAKINRLQVRKGAAQCDLFQLF